MKRKWVWCSKCSRCYEHDVPEKSVEEEILDEIKQAGGFELYCYYDDCTGTFVDAVPWADVREKYPNYAAVPETGCAYLVDKDLLVV